ncbi:unnamed protein product [Orchesella dallaii]|uniref:VWFA domain-containing protein n=1 Tax=Orchesella dallaii TaxID=48710 RepID=A0ABP1Q1R2_9HEXA
MRMLLHIVVQLALLGFLTQTIALYGFYNGKCFDESDKYQILIALDRTDETILADARGPLKEVINHLRIKLYYATFAVVSFADWGQETWYDWPNLRPEDRSRFLEHEDPEGCYKLEKPFTTRHIEYKSVQAQLDRVQLLTHFGTENILSAISWAIVDKKIGWSTDPEMKKLVIVVTNSYDHDGLELVTPGDRKPSKLDGSDTCSNNLIVEIEEAKKLLERNKVILYILLSYNDKMEFWEETKDWYNKNPNFFGVPFKLSKFYTDDNKPVKPEKLAEDIKNRLDELDANEKGTFTCPD